MRAKRKRRFIVLTNCQESREFRTRQYCAATSQARSSRANDGIKRVCSGDITDRIHSVETMAQPRPPFAPVRIIVPFRSVMVDLNEAERLLFSRWGKQEAGKNYLYSPRAVFLGTEHMVNIDPSPTLYCRIRWMDVGLMEVMQGGGANSEVVVDSRATVANQQNIAHPLLKVLDNSLCLSLRRIDQVHSQ
ncbi:uncharacterized protein BDR25DRAFT_349073 [Lindgomyces ingoldianus]|uniref:Uncharacterized protein n=1 Tax=Lindgomyces ingoldianus TaxID=673940 RepID=A0ACB6RDG0_9PLEO|nr:uncharacterized protein BDR25DRAFT_349073 [Lindgomyces ingoldianus]KAF2477176.1 hypothetical protein BDR25DRAFT_349073 [Lindgomyces ingoldianus]